MLAAVGLGLRLPRLGQRPMHCDEGTQAYSAGTLFDTGEYQYNPVEHHGPTMPWLTRAVLWLSGTADYAHSTAATYRLVPVVFSVGLILLLLALGDGLGRAAALMAGLLTAISPAVVFYGRYYIHETLLVFFTLAAIAAGWGYVRTRALGWAAAAGAAVGLMCATKETWILAVAAMAAGLWLALVWTRWREGVHPALGGWLRPGAIVAATAAALLAAAAFYSSFGTNWPGLSDALATYAVYFRRGSQAGIHTHPWYYYLELLFACRPARGFFWSEGLIGVLAAVGFGAALWGRGLTAAQRPLPRFLAFYTLVLTALYCAVPYKTPWCLLSFLQGMILLAGVAAAAVFRAVKSWPGKAALGLLLAAGVAHLGWQCYWLNFRLSADQRNPWVYAHTSTDVEHLAARMEEIAQVATAGHEMVIHVVTPENVWPLPWYLRQFNPDHVGYWLDPSKWAKTADRGEPPAVVILTPDVQPLVDAHLRGAYNRQMLFGLRPGVLLCVYVRDDLWRAVMAGR